MNFIKSYSEAFRTYLDVIFAIAAGTYFKRGDVIYFIQDWSYDCATGRLKFNVNK